MKCFMKFWKHKNFYESKVNKKSTEGILYNANCSRWKSFVVFADYLVTAKLFHVKPFRFDKF